MKNLKVLLLSLFVVVALAGTAYAFSNQSESTVTEAKQTVVIYEYIGPQPPTLADLQNLANWRLVVVLPCPQIQQRLCAITFNNGQYTLAQAIAKVPVGPYVNGTNVGTGTAPVTIFTKP